ncbi:flagellar assembly peptidoglycan hydrolase FlgJ [Enterobacter cloacae]|uniref:flagellar assembly peptidoglycan hydrolase FlgJ n=1 Tax=Enterobacter cloacae TaxID=550 RepID=UPI00129ED931|nr:flagellar assembly peptidoglycan hydrolase FlgJ [Enterobacter cloacae]MCK7338333.1 flagellar assembly peptidoglycan hydrolase FlgJ [Enterobacter cloacae]MCR1553448.1 flagellar assembly peptidoglycan hydrolase FlgJ [Enterobacter cloacae]MCU6199971.1 flagellar assembly peptidoglycan hydrolase FlgJ [Enterobacter cloacae]MRM11399.1 flagellar assembly peptidoglycan hydrolase FlgJ [Enterobacter cloacae subsp. dissolvens]HDC4370698.1 flagellar assembly peptidoglycan hydrolase FlgJ [Enterobacter cl
MNAFDKLDQPAFDVRSLDTLKREAGRQSPGALKAAAKQMEGIFVQMMMKSMRDATFKDDLLNSQSSEMYTAMHDQQVAQNIAGSGQLGFADLIVRQLGGEVDEPVVSTPGRDLLRPGLSATPATGPLRLPAPVSFAKPADGAHPFIARLLRPAQAAAQQSGLHPHLILAQAALESGWGKREIPAADGGPSHNLFGIKATGDWQGKTTEITTTEYINGVKQKVKAAFRVYDSYEHALADYAKLLTRNPRYRGVVQSGSPEQGAKALQAGGYATDPAYAKKLITIIQKVKGDIQQGVNAYKHDLDKIF